MASFGKPSQRISASHPHSQCQHSGGNGRERHGSVHQIQKSFEDSVLILHVQEVLTTLIACSLFQEPHSLLQERP